MPLFLSSGRSRPGERAAALTVLVAAVIALTAAPALASPPETPEVTGASAITATTATLEGVLNPAAPGLPGSYQFSYAPSETLECAGGNVAPLPPAFATGLEKEAVSTAVTELQPNREYAFCLTAFSLAAEPSSPSTALSFKTPAAAPSVDAESTSAVTSTTATLEAQVNPNNEATTYTFEYSTEQKAGVLEGTIVTVPAAPGGPLEGFGDQTASAPTETLLPDTTYFYRVVATNATGTTDGTVSETGFTTVATPTTEAATGVTSTTATFHGTLNPLTETVRAEAEYSFAYAQGSEDCTAGTSTTPTGAGTGTGPQAVEAEVTGLQPGASYSVCLVSSNPFGSEVDPTVKQVQFTTLAGPPTIEAESSSSVGTESATLEATVNPNNQESTCSFEYSTEEAKVEKGEGTAVPCSQPLGAVGSPVTGSATLTGLQLKQTYYYRALAKNASGAVSDPTIEHFETETAPAPSLEGEATTGITETSATLNGKVNPNGAQITACKFEYGSTGMGEYTQTAPCAHPDAAEVRAGREPVAVSVALTELKPNITYHWRLVAISAAGTTTSVDQTFVDDTSAPTPPGSCPGQEQVREAASSLNLPDCRAYEMVTPPEKNGAHIDALFAGTGAWGPLISADGTDVMAPSIQCFAGSESCTGLRSLGEGEPYEFARTGSGWVTNPLAPPASTFGNTSQLNEDATTHDTLFTAPGEGHRDHFYLRTGSGTPADIGPVAENPETVDGEHGGLLPNADPTNATADFSHLLFAAHFASANGALWSLDGSPEKEFSLYEYAGTGNKQPLLVGVSGGFDSRNLISECGTTLGDSPYSVAAEYGSLSANGHIVYFTAVGHDNHEGCTEAATAPSHNELLARIDGENPGLAHTVAVSAPAPGSCETVECKASQAPADSRDASFAGAATDGSRVFFTSTQQLTDNASQMAEEPGNGGEAGKNCHLRAERGCNLYESVCAEPCGTHEEEPAAAERELIDVSDPHGTAPVPGGPRVQGVMAISPDGSHVYFVARGVIPGAQENQAHEHPADGKENLYVYQRDEDNPSGELAFIATLPKSDAEEFEQQQFLEFTEGVKAANVTPDGRFLVFLSHAALTPDDTRPDVEGGPPPPAQIYRYDAKTGQMVRVSIGQDGFNDNNNSGPAQPDIVHTYKGWQTAASPGTANPTMSEDGREVFFESPVALAPGALNEVEVGGGTRELLAQNIYEYRDGQVYLISDGKDTNPNPGDPSTKSSTRLIGTDESGKNVFFFTTSQVLPEDTDTQRDIYDARICESGDPCVPPPAPAGEPCKEGGCQGAAPTSPASAAPGSASFSGAGNLTPPQPAAPVKPKPLTRAQKLTKALKACRIKHNRHKRSVCEKQARHQFGTAAKARKAADKHRGAGR